MIPRARLSLSTQVVGGISEKQEGAKKQDQETNYDDDHDEDHDDDDGGGDGEAAGRGRSAPGKIFAPGGKLVSERLRSMTEDERVRTAQQERSAEWERKRGEEGWKIGSRKIERPRRRENGRVRNEEGGCFASVTWRYSGLLVSASLSRVATSSSLSLSLFQLLPFSPSCPLLIRVIRYYRRWLRR